jgi:hypothetical protein
LSAVAMPFGSASLTKVTPQMDQAAGEPRAARRGDVQRRLALRPLGIDLIGDARAEDGGQTKCRLAKARPDPVFRYRSNATALFTFVNSMAATSCHGRLGTV